MIRIFQWGMFDVASYGNLLAPLILEAQLKKRLGDIDSTLCSPDGGTFPADQSRQVRRIIKFQEPDFYSQVDAGSFLIFGGSELVSFGLNCGLVEDLALIAQVTPVLWNSVGVPFDFNEFDQPRVSEAVKDIKYLSVRDQVSKLRLEQTGLNREVHVVPDSSFLLRETFDDDTIVRTVEKLKAAGYVPKDRSFLTLQIEEGLLLDDETAEVLISLLNAHPHLELVILPIGVLKNPNSVEHCKYSVGNQCRVVSEIDDPVKTAAIIAHSAFFVGPNLQANITAGIFGVPSLALHKTGNLPPALKELASLLGRPESLVTSMEGLRSKLPELVTGKHSINNRLILAAQSQVAAHFDRIAEEISRAQKTLPLHNKLIEAYTLVHKGIQPVLFKENSQRREPARFTDEDRLERLGEAEQEIQSLKSLVESQERDLRTLSQLQESQKNEVQLLTNQLKARNKELDRIKSSLGWRVLSRYGRFKHQYLLPALDRAKKTTAQAGSSRTNRPRNQIGKGVYAERFAGLPFLDGTCNICGSVTSFYYDSEEFYRESLNCGDCLSTSRYRSIARGVLLTLKSTLGVEAESLSDIKNLTNERFLQIYDTQVPFKLYHNAYVIPEILSSYDWINVLCSIYRPKLAPGAFLGPSITNQDLQQLSFTDSSLDLVITSDVLEHVRLADRAHSEIRRVLKPGGIYLFTVPHFRDRETVHRVEIVDPDDPSKDKFVMDKEYHGDTNSITGRSLCYRSYGTDLDEQLKELGFTVSYTSQNFPEHGIMNSELFFCCLTK